MRFSLLILFFAFNSFSADFLNNSCLGCGVKASESQRLFTCSGCHEAKYCGQKCQKNHRSQHKARCSKKILEKNVGCIKLGFEEMKTTDQISHMHQKYKDLNEKIREYSFWQSFDVDKVTKDCLDRFYIRLKSTDDSENEYSWSILDSAFLDFATISMLWDAILKNVGNNGALLNNIDDAYIAMSLRFHANMNMPNNFFSTVAKEIAPNGFYIAKHNAFMNTFFNNREKSGKVNIIQIAMALEILDSMDALKKIYERLLPGEKTTSGTHASAEFTKMSLIGEKIEKDEIRGSGIFHLRGLMLCEIEDSARWLDSNIKWSNKLLRNQ